MYYRKVVDDNGNETFEETEVDLSTIPDDVFYKDTRYREVADRDAKRRIELKKLKQQLESKQQNDTSNNTPDKPVTPDVDKIFEEVKKRLEEENKQRQEREQTIKTIMEKHKLKPDAFAILEASKDPEFVAAKLGAMGYVFEDSNSGETNGGVNDYAAIFAKINKELGLE